MNGLQTFCLIFFLSLIWKGKVIRFEPNTSCFVSAFISGRIYRSNCRWTNIHFAETNGLSCDKVVVTGLGIISPAGNTVDGFFQCVTEGKSAVCLLDRFDSTKFKCKIAAQVRDFRPNDYYHNKKRSRENDLSCHFAVAAARNALHDAGISFGQSNINWDRVGVIVGSGLGGVESFERAGNDITSKGPNHVSPYTIPMLLGNFPAAIVSMEVGARGPSFGVQTACSTATHAIGQALNCLRQNHADIVIAGGTDAPLTPLVFAGFQSLRILSTVYNDEPHAASRPFDFNRDGFVMAEGAGVLILEKLSHAVRRGFGASSDSHHITSPDPSGSGMTRALSLCMRDAGMKSSDIQYINAHGSSTKKNDLYETLSIKSAFAEHARHLKISSIKGCTGHALGASGGFEAVSCVKSLESTILPPTINYETLDPSCDLDYIPNKAIKFLNLNSVLSCSSGFGGHNGVIALRKIS